MSRFAAAAVYAASCALAHLPVQEGVDSTNSQPKQIIDVCNFDQEHAVYATLDSREDVDIYELVVPEDSAEFFIHVAIPALPLDLPDRRRSAKISSFPGFHEQITKGIAPKKEEVESPYPKCTGNDARPIIAVVGPGIKTNVPRSFDYTAMRSGCGYGSNRLPFYVAADEGVVLNEYKEDFPYYEDFESGFTVVGDKKFVDLKKGTYKFYVWDAQGRKGDYIAIFGKNEDCYKDGRGYGPVGLACQWLVDPDFHTNCGARPDIPACCCFLEAGTGVCPSDVEVLDDFCTEFRTRGPPSLPEDTTAPVGNGDITGAPDALPPCFLVADGVLPAGTPCAE